MAVGESLVKNEHASGPPDVDSSALDEEENPLGAEAQRRFWNAWNATHRGADMRLPPPNTRQAATILSWLRQTDRGPREIVEIGCGSGWFSAQLTPFGSVRGIDIADEAIAAARDRYPEVAFRAGDFMAMELERGSADVVVSLEALAHVADPGDFMFRTARLLRDDGLLLLATQNRFVIERMDGVPPPGPGRFRNWVNARELRAMLRPHFDILQLSSLHAEGHRGVLRILNSSRVRTILATVGMQSSWDALKERALLGHTLMVLARKRQAS